jgi:hypothetical protein
MMNFVFYICINILKVLHFVKSAKIMFCLAAALFVAKPFLGFSMFSRMHPPSSENIFVKVFTKRKLEDNESKKSSVEAIQKKLADAGRQFLLRYSFLLSILFPIIFLSGVQINERFLRKHHLSLALTEPSWILNCKLVI